MKTQFDSYKKLKQHYEILSLIVSAMKADLSKAKVTSHLSESLTLNERTIKWGIDKNIIGENGQGTAWAQSTKLLEEAQETYDAVSDVNIEEIKDGIGDVIISATLLAHMHDLTMDECHEAALEVIEKRTGKMVDGTFVRDDSSNLNKQIKNTHTQFEIWYRNDARLISNTKELCRIAWENGSYCALNPSAAYNKRPEASSDPDDDFNEPLGQSCQLGDETCESCQ